ncbi:surface antigen [Rhizomicrobium palustre]|uniref:Surface antigen n=1 Tax=Rhizomicrobium palustre TaxID=189966 RepID=A0A846N287_9PROT|nr:YMGG-like glycine zipper-containing protein [Rhizomicrobium palustre]NIK89619.1 surface antigen [Rhizomicrobium palustre]
MLISAQTSPAFAQDTPEATQQGDDGSNECTAHKTTTGAVVGLLLGALIGGLAGGKNAAQNALIGGLAGASVGGLIGNSLDREDCERYRQSRLDALYSGQSTRWEGTKATGETQVLSEENQATTLDVAVDESKIEVMPDLIMVAGNYSVISDTIVRSGPEDKYRPVTALGKGDKIDVFGQAKDGKWYLVGVNGVSKGFVPPSALQSERKPVSRAAVVVAEAGTIKHRKLAATGICRTTQQTVSMRSGGDQREVTRSCMNPDGTWTTQKV